MAPRSFAGRVGPGGKGGLRGLHGGLRRGDLGVGDELLPEEVCRAFQVLLELEELGLALHGRGARGRKIGFTLVDLIAVVVRLDADQQVTLLHHRTLAQRQLDDLARNLGRDLDLDLGLDLAGRVDELRDGLGDRLLGRDGEPLVARLVLVVGGAAEGGDGEQAAEDEPERAGASRNRGRSGSDGGGGGIHGQR